MQTALDTTPVAPGAAWAFNADVTTVFDDMLRRSIPQYEVMRATVFDVACVYVQPGTGIVDLGCSRGDALAPFVDKYGAQNHYLGLEISLPMLAAARERFRLYIQDQCVTIREWDLRCGLPPVPGGASVLLSVLTLQFTPIEYRQAIMRAAWKALKPGGALLLVEKLLGASADLDALMARQYYDVKRHNGYSQDEIDRKRLSLEGVLVPVTARWNEELLRGAGFTQVDCIWRWLNFAAWVAVKD